jgi:hypothetical protein
MFWCPNLDIHKFPKCKNGNVRSAFWDFCVQGFAVFIAKHPTYHNSLIVKRKALTIQDFGVRDFGVSNVKPRNTIIHEIAKTKRTWN